ncbi:hypothetical protein [Shewanella sp.]|uniref:hypothetical protein n=1 Tax=Shewanella sp. TaxID=50422 RepID=UPI0035650B25
MIYSQFHTPPLHQRFSGLKGLAMFVAGLVVMGLSLVALPFILLAGAVAFALLSVFGRIWLGKLVRRAQHAQAKRTETQFEAETSDAFIRFRDRDLFRPRPHQGRTFDHDPTE